MSVNSILQNMIIERQHDLNKYKNFEIQKVSFILDEAEKELKAIYGEYSGVTSWTKKKQSEINKKLDTIIEEVTDEIQDTLNSDMKSLGYGEAEFQKNAIESTIKDQTNGGVTWKFLLPTALYLFNRTNKEYIVLKDGTTILPSQLYSKYYNSYSGRIKQTTLQGMLAGKNGSEISYDIFTGMGVYNILRNQMRATVSTAVVNYAEQGVAGFNEENEEYIEGYMWNSVMDSKTSDICSFLNNKVYYYNDAEASTLSYERYPPAHFGGCRSTTVPLIKRYSDVTSENSIEYDGTLNGKTPAPVTYSEWFNGQSATTQRDVLGATRYTMWKKGDITVDKFNNQDGRKLTLNELKSKGYKIPDQYLRYLK